MHEVLGVPELKVKTFRHQAVKRLADGFAISARTEDGLIEAVERRGTLFMIGVQYHRDKLRSGGARFNALSVRFLDAATSSSR